MNSVSSAAHHVGSHAMYARDRVSATYMYFSGTYFTSRSYRWSWRIIRCNLGEALAIHFFRNYTLEDDDRCGRLCSCHSHIGEM